MHVVVIGIGYVGLTTAAALAELGHSVVGLDIDPLKVARLRDGHIPIYEPGLEPLVRENLTRGRLAFTEDYSAACQGAEVILIAVDTPTAENWEIRLDSLEHVARDLARHTPPEAVIILKSTVPPGTNVWFRRLFREAHPTHHEPTVVSNPEFLREGQAVSDTFHPDRLVLGTVEDEGLGAMMRLYEPLIHGRYDSPLIPPAPAAVTRPIPVVATNPATAELIKYAANAFLATKISFINEIANVCETVGADVTQVAQGIGMDRRIGREFLNAGLGFGGSCFPKDTKALSFKAGSKGYQFTLLNAVIEVNKLQRYRFITRVREALKDDWPNLTLAVFGLSFKPNTDDTRESPAIDIMRELHREGLTLRATDPVAIHRASQGFSGCTYFEDPYECAAGCDAVILATEWPQFVNLDWARIGQGMKQLFLFDGRNALDPSAMRALGYTYYGIGRQ